MAFEKLWAQILLALPNLQSLQVPLLSLFLERAFRFGYWTAGEIDKLILEQAK